MFSLPVVLKTQFRSIRLSLGLYDRNGVVPSSQWYTMLIACTHYNAILSGTLGLTNSDVACRDILEVPVQQAIAQTIVQGKIV